MSGSGLSNSDFKAMLASPSPSGEGGSSASLSYEERKKQAQEEVRLQMNREKMAKTRFKRKAAKSHTKAKQSKGPSAPQYRDRAKERREGKLEDYGSLTEASLASQGEVTSVFSSNAEESGVSALKALSREESKFLGGDMEHTHLVKGLDYALLRKVRAELESEEGPKDMRGVQGAANGAAPVAGRGRGGGGRGLSMGGKIWEALVDVSRQHGALVNGHSPRLGPGGRRPGRCTYLMDVDLQNRKKDFAMPTTLLNSMIDEEEDDDELFVCAPSDETTQKISEVMDYVHRGRKKKKKKNPPPAAVPQAVVPNSSASADHVDDDDDLNIFDDVEEAEYVCDDIEKAVQERLQEPKKEDSQAAKPKPYFAASSKPAEQSEVDISSMSGFLSKKQMDMLKPLPKKRAYSDVEDADERDPMHAEDYYSECYAGTYEIGPGKVVVDTGSDDEDFSMMDAGATNKKELRPWDFNTQEEWERYMNTREATPEAAFQYGLKKGDRRKRKKLKKAAVNSRDYHKVSSKR